MGQSAYSRNVCANSPNIFDSSFRPVIAIAVCAWANWNRNGSMSIMPVGGGMNLADLTEKPVCGTCARWTQCGDYRMPDHGECEYRDVWQYSHRRSSCLLTPSSWVKKNAKK